MGMLVESSVFGDVIFQLGICSSGSLNGLIKGTQYNHAWFCHSIFLEALERLLLTRFLAEVIKFSTPLGMRLGKKYVGMRTFNGIWFL